jgi:hypothetical protein
MNASDRDAVLRCLIRYAVGLGFSETTVRVLYKAVVGDAMIVQADGTTEVRRFLPAAANA